MLQLFRIEWMKIKNYRTFWILFGGFVLLFPVTILFAASKFDARPESQQEEMIRNMLGNPFAFPKIWHTSSYFAGLYFIMIGMLFIMLITNEVQYRTHRQNIIDGWSRLDFLKAKASMLIFFVTSATILVVLTALLTGSIYTHTSTGNITTGLKYVLYFVLMATMYLVIGYFIAILVKRTGLAIIIYFAVVCIIDNILWLVLTMRKSQIGYLLPLESTDSLLPNPFKPGVLENRTLTDQTLIITAVIYLILFVYFIQQHFRRIDLRN
jgi:hypothetical protein